MAHADLVFFQQRAHLFGQRQHAQQVGDMAAALMHGGGQHFLRVAEFVHQALVADGFFQRIEVAALDVFHERQFERQFVLHFANDHGNGIHARHLRGAPAAFTGDNFVFIVRYGAHEDGLHHAVLADGFGEFRKRGRIKIAARLEFTGLERGKRQANFGRGSGGLFFFGRRLWSNRLLFFLHQHLFIHLDLAVAFRHQCGKAFAKPFSFGERFCFALRHKYFLISLLFFVAVFKPQPVLYAWLRVLAILLQV